MIPTLLKLRRYAVTAGYLKPVQLWGRVWFKCRAPHAPVRPAPRTAQLQPHARFAMARRSFADGKFSFLNVPGRVESAADWNRAERGKLWLYNLHYFDWLRQPELTAEEGNAWIIRWIAENPPFRGNGWEPYPVSLRIVNWIKWALSGHDLPPETLDSLATQVRCLRRRLERHLLANHYLANAKALVFAGLFFSGDEAEGWLAAGCEIYREQLPLQILSDGGHFERSPMYHCIILEDLLDLANVGAPLFLKSTIAKMLNWLAAMTGPDGKPARFNDAADGIAPTPKELFDYAERLGFGRPAEPPPCLDLPATGYARLSAGAWTTICDGGAIGPDYQPGHAHADTLNFELWHDSTRLLIDSGTGEYVDTPLRREQRGTAGHNTLTVNGKNSSDVWGAHRVASRAAIVERSFGANVFSAAHDGFRTVIHSRSWEVSEKGVTITDALRGRGGHDVVLYWHFPPGAWLELFHDRVVVGYEGRRYSMSLEPGGEHLVSVGHFSPEFGVVKENPVLSSRYRAELPLVVKTLITTEA